MAALPNKLSKRIEPSSEPPAALVPPVPAAGPAPPVTEKEPPVLLRMMPLAVPPVEVTLASVIPSVVIPAGPVILTAEAPEASTVPLVLLIVPSAVDEPIAVALLVKMLTVPSPYVPVPPAIVTA